MISKVTAQYEDVMLKPIQLKDLSSIAELYTENTVQSSAMLQTHSKLRAFLYTLRCLLTHNYHYAAFLDDTLIGIVDVKRKHNNCNRLGLLFKTAYLYVDSTVDNIVNIACTTVCLYSKSPIVCSIPIKSKLNAALLSCGFKAYSCANDNIAYVMKPA